MVPDFSQRYAQAKAVWQWASLHVQSAASYLRARFYKNPNIGQDTQKMQAISPDNLKVDVVAVSGEASIDPKEALFEIINKSVTASRQAINFEGQGHRLDTFMADYAVDPVYTTCVNQMFQEGGLIKLDSDAISTFAATTGVSLHQYLQDSAELASKIAQSPSVPAA